MTPREREEYRALRATIQSRGTTRTWIVVLGLTSWAALSIVTLALELPPISALSSLVVLAGAFEAVLALHVSVERIGRYLQVFFEDRWEQVAMEFGAPLAGTSVDPLFAVLFGIAALLNLLTSVSSDTVPAEITVLVAAHLLFAARVVSARRTAARQRSSDLDRFRTMKLGK